MKLEVIFICDACQVEPKKTNERLTGENDLIADKTDVKMPYVCS
jgi:hypothetical protein